MSIWLTVPADQLVANWRALRKELAESNLSELEILERVETYFSTRPRSTRSIDYYTPASWPSPWEIIHEHLWCNTAVTLMQYYTLLLLPNIDQSKIQLYLIESTHDEYVIIVYDNKYMLNYYYGEVLDFEKNKRFFNVSHVIDKKEIPQIS